MKFAMGADTLAQLTKQTSTSSEDLTRAVKDLAEAAAPLEGRFNGAARGAFDAFKGSTDAIAAELNASLRAVLSGISGMDKSFAEGTQEMADQTRQAQASTPGGGYDAGRFGAQG